MDSFGNVPSGAKLAPEVRRPENQGRRTVKKLNNYFIAATVGLTAVAFAGQALAQGQAQSARDAAIAVCVSQAQKEYPDSGPGGDNMANRTASYKACMTSKGQNP